MFFNIMSLGLIDPDETKSGIQFDSDPSIDPHLVDLNVFDLNWAQLNKRGLFDLGEGMHSTESTLVSNLLFHQEYCN